MEKDISCKQKEQEIRDNDTYIIISILLYFNIKAITKDKEGHYIMIKELVQEETVTLVNICT